MTAVEAWLSHLRERFTARTLSRFVSVFLALGTGAVLATAMWLEPSPLGHSTHLQLGLGQCTFLSLTGFPCPMCGATTTFTLMAHLHPIRALLTQPFAALLFCLTTGVFGVSMAEVVQPRDRWQRLSARVEPYEGGLAALFLAFMALAWGYKIVLMKGVFDGVSILGL